MNMDFKILTQINKGLETPLKSRFIMGPIRQRRKEEAVHDTDMDSSDDQK
jgi:hypothetical protein